MPTLHALGLNCSLKGAGAPSSTDVLVSQVLDELRDAGVAVDGPVRVAALDVKPGVSSDEGPGDDWPELRRRILDADILVFGTPIWLGQPSSIAKRVTERMDAFLSETDDEGRLVSVGRVAVVAVVGNEDGADHRHRRPQRRPHGRRTVVRPVPAGALTTDRGPGRLRRPPAG